MTDLEQVAASHGFTAVKSEPISEVEGTVHLMHHAASGARLMFIENDDANKAFSITFKTPADDDTGVFHILEHSVLCGSEKFPVKEPFVELAEDLHADVLKRHDLPGQDHVPRGVHQRAGSRQPHGRLPGRGLPPRYLPAPRHLPAGGLAPRAGRGGRRRAPCGERRRVQRDERRALRARFRALRRAVGGAVPGHDLPFRVWRHAGGNPNAHLRGLSREPSAPLPSRQRLHHPIRQPGCRPLPRLSRRALFGAAGRERARAAGHQPARAAGSRGSRASCRAHGHRAGERLRCRGLRHRARRRARAHRGRRHLDGRHHGGQRVAPEAGAARRGHRRRRHRVRGRLRGPALRRGVPARRPARCRR